MCEAMIAEAPEKLRRIYMFSASQARGHREAIARFLLSPPEPSPGLSTVMNAEVLSHEP